jgi:hypothetical protein
MEAPTGYRRRPKPGSDICNPGAVRLHGVGLPPPRPWLPKPERLGAATNPLVPESLAVVVAEAWRRDGLSNQVVHLATKTRAYGTVHQPTSSYFAPLDVTTEVLNTALNRLQPPRVRAPSAAAE